MAPVRQVFGGSELPVGFLQERVAAVSLEVMRERDAFNQSELKIDGKK